MKNNFLKFIEYLCYLSFIVLFILYLYPGSLIGYFLYGDFGKQPDLIDNPIGTSINHFFSFMFLTTLAVICNLKKKRILTNIYFIFFVSIFLEVLHYVIPNRAFEFYDLLANVAGVLVIVLLSKVIR